MCDGSGPDLPPAMLHVAVFPLAMYLMSSSDFPMGSLGMVHIANRIEVTGQLPALGGYEVRVQAGNACRHPKGTQFDMVTSSRLDGERLSRGSDLSSARATAERTSWPDPTQTVEVVNLEIPADMGRQHDAISGDCNPVHLHPLAARPSVSARPSSTGCGLSLAAWLKWKANYPWPTSPRRASSSQCSFPRRAHCGSIGETVM